MSHDSFYFKEILPPARAHYTAWSPDLRRMKELFHLILAHFSEENVEILLKTLSGLERGKTRWLRTYGILPAASVARLIESYEKVFFQNERVELSIQRIGRDDRVTLDGHGILYLDAEDERFDGLFQRLDFAERQEPFLSESIRLEKGGGG